MAISADLIKPLIFVSGKGGVGKTTLANSLALIAQNSDFTATVVAIDPVTTSSQNFVPTLSLTPQNCLDEYAQIKFGKTSLRRALLKSPLIARFMDGVPGLSPLLMLGKIDHMVRQHALKKQKATVIVDLPATGHGLSLLNVPYIVQRAIAAGPLRRHAEEILATFADSKTTRFYPITLAEETPVRETSELIASIANKTQIDIGYLFINAVVPKLANIEIPNQKISKNLKPYFDSFEFTRKRRQTNEEAIKLAKNLMPKQKLISLPFAPAGFENKLDFNFLIDHINDQDKES